MDKSLIEQLLPLVNLSGNELKAYAEYRLNLVYKNIPQASDLGYIKGQIAELEQLLKLRDVVNQRAKEYAGS